MAVEQAVAGTVRTRGRPVRWLAVAVALVVLAAPLATWQVLARAPRLVPGEFSRRDEAAVPDPARELDSVVTDPADGTYDGMWSFRNTGPVPVTVRIARPGPDARPAQDPTVRALHLVPVDPRTGQVGWDLSVDTVRLARGDSVGVAFRLGTGCRSWPSGTGYGDSSVLLDVESLGVTRTVLADGGWTARVAWTHDVAPDPATCAG